MTKDSYIRAARPRDFERICDAGAASMLEDPVMSYFGCTTPVSSERFRVSCIMLSHLIPLGLVKVVYSFYATLDMANGRSN